MHTAGHEHSLENVSFVAPPLLGHPEHVLVQAAKVLI